jgi:hypothetical protein
MVRVIPGSIRPESMDARPPPLVTHHSVMSFNRGPHLMCQSHGNPRPQVAPHFQTISIMSRASSVKASSATSAGFRKHFYDSAPDQVTNQRLVREGCQM